MTDETKVKISNSTKGRVPWNKGKKNDVKYIYYTNGIKNIRIPFNKEPPKGFYKGRIRKPLSKISKQSFIKNIKYTKLQRYGDENYNNVKKNLETKLRKYGKTTYNNREEASLTCLNKYGVTNAAKCKLVSNKISLKLRNHYVSEETKMKISSKAKNRTYSQETINKRFNTMKNKGTINSSKKEDIYYNYLLTKYKTVYRQYRDSRYPFSCDFYIPCEDRFIELNSHWTHGGRPYDANDAECQSQLKLWEEKAKTSKYYQNAIYVWTKLDVRKYKTFIDNKLKFTIVYN